MLDAPEITRTTEQLAAVIHLTIAREEMRNAMGPAIGELMATIAAQSITAAGPLFSHHLTMPSDRFDFEVGVPIAAPVVAAGRVKPGRLPAARVARTVYHGAYEGLGSAWSEFIDWIAANDLTPGPNLWESYVSGPESSPDPAHWRTELNRPLLD